MSIPKDKVQIYAPTGLHTAGSGTMLLQLGTAGARKRSSPNDSLDDSESKQAGNGVRFPSLEDDRIRGGGISPSGAAGQRHRRRSSVLSEVGALVAPVDHDEVAAVASEANEVRANTLIRRVQRWVMRPRDIFSLRLFRRGKSSIPQSYRRGHLPSDAAWYIMDPKSTLLKRWDIFIMVLLLYTAIVTPYEVGFVEPKLDFWFFFNRFIDMSFLVDLCVNFVTARFNDEEANWIYRFRDIASIYLRSWFAIDLVSILPFDIMGLVMDSDAVSQFRLLRVVRLLRLLKLARILRASRIFRRWENSISLSYSFMSLIKFMVGVSTVAHWMACAWRIVVDIEDATHENWLRGYQPMGVGSYDFEEAGPAQQYMVALYWAVMTITTIGYGDVVAKSHGERVMATLCMLVGASIYAYVVGAVCGIVSGLDEATAKFHQTMDQLNSYMSEYHIPKALQYSLREYFRHCRNLSRERHYHDLLIQMSPSLRGQVAVFCHSAWILKVPFFNSDTVSDEEREQFIIEIATSIEPESYPPNEAIFRVNKPAKEMYIIQKGVVAKQGHILRGGMFFGEDMILKSYKRPYSVRTLTYVDVFKLTKEKLEDIIQHDEFPATRIAIRKATIALAFRVKFVALATALGAFTNSEPLPRRSNASPAGGVRAKLAAAAAATGVQSDDQFLIPPGQTMPAPVTPQPSLDEGGSDGSGALTVNPVAAQPRTSASADAGAGDAKPMPPRRDAFGSDAAAGAGAGVAAGSGGGTTALSPAAAGHVDMSDVSDEDSPTVVVASNDLVSPHTVGTRSGGGSYKQIRPSVHSQQMADIARMVERRHRETMETMMLEFNKLSKRMDDMADRMDTIQATAATRRLC